MTLKPISSHPASSTLAAALLLAAVSVHAQPATPPAAADGKARVVRIAHVGPLSGPASHLGKDAENGVRLALQDLNAQDLRIGSQRVRFVLVPEDDQGEPTQAIAVARRLCDRGHIAGVVGHLQSGTSLPASRLYHACGIPHITASATNPDLTKPGYATTYRVIASDAALGAALALYAAEQGIRKIAVIDDRTAYGQGVTELFTTTARAKGIDVVATEFTRDRAVDFMAILTAIKAMKPEAIFYGGLDAQAGPMLRQMQQLGMDQVRFLGGDGVCTEMLPALASHVPLIERVTCVTGGVAVDKMPGGPTWKARYDAAYPGRFQVFSPYAYDAATVLVSAMQRADSVDPRVFVPALRQTDHAGVTARIRFTDKGELAQPAVTFFVYRDRQRVSLN